MYGNEIGFTNHWKERLYILVGDELYAANKYQEKGSIFYIIIITIIKQGLINGKKLLVKKPNFSIISIFILNYSYQNLNYVFITFIFKYKMYILANKCRNLYVIKNFMIQFEQSDCTNLLKFYIDSVKSHHM